MSDQKRLARLTLVGECAIRGAIEKLKRSYFDSILEYGLAEGSKYYVEFKKLKENYDENTLPEWIEKMDRHEGVNLSAVYGAYVEQMTALRVIKVSESASILRNVLRRDVEDVLSGFECFYDTKHTIAQLKEGIDDVKKKIKVLREGSVQTSHPPECIGAGVIVPNLIRELAFVPEYKDPIKEYGEEYGPEKTNKHDLDHFFTVLQDHEVRYRQYIKKREQRSARDGSDAGSAASAVGTTLLSQTDSHEGGTDIPECHQFQRKGKCSFGDQCIFEHRSNKGELLNDPAGARKTRKAGGGDRGSKSGGGRGHGQSCTYYASYR